jgi:hypothetical protein
MSIKTSFSDWDVFLEWASPGTMSKDFSLLSFLASFTSPVVNSISTSTNKPAPGQCLCQDPIMEHLINASKPYKSEAPIAQ